jgi:hypothetical protein
MLYLLYLWKLFEVVLSNECSDFTLLCKPELL